MDKSRRHVRRHLWWLWSAVTVDTTVYAIMSGPTIGMPFPSVMRLDKDICFPGKKLRIWT
jgi:hypothetical protein